MENRNINVLGTEYIIETHKVSEDSYLEENNITNVKKICSDEFCDYLRSVNLTKGISIYEEKCEKYWQEKIGFQKAYEMKIKGFPITDILLMGE